LYAPRAEVLETGAEGENAAAEARVRRVMAELNFMVVGGVVTL